MFGSRNHVTWYNQEQIQRMSAYPMGGSLCRRTPKLVPSWAPSTEAPWDDCCWNPGKMMEKMDEPDKKRWGSSFQGIHPNGDPPKKKSFSPKKKPWRCPGQSLWCQATTVWETERVKVEEKVKEAKTWGKKWLPLVGTCWNMLDPPKIWSYLIHFMGGPTSLCSCFFRIHTLCFRKGVGKQCKHVRNQFCRKSPGIPISLEFQYVLSFLRALQVARVKVEVRVAAERLVTANESL